jgi:DNA-binding CsgD family transcriptional regulator
MTFPYPKRVTFSHRETINNWLKSGYIQLEGLLNSYLPRECIPSRSRGDELFGFDNACVHLSTSPQLLMETRKSPQEFLQAILEGFVDGILVLTEQQEALYANATARHFCHQLNPAGSRVWLPREVWQVCEALIDSRSLCPDRGFVIESEVNTDLLKLRIRAQWLQLDGLDQPGLLVRLQDQNQAMQSLAIAEAQTWNLTERETQVWLLRRSGYTRKQIAAELHIALDTVKKHLKNVQLKRLNYLSEDEWRSQQTAQMPGLPCSA